LLNWQKTKQVLEGMTTTYTLFIPHVKARGKEGHKPRSKAPLSAAKLFRELSCPMKPHSNHSLILQV